MSTATPSLDAPGFRFEKGSWLAEGLAAMRATSASTSRPPFARLLEDGSDRFWLFDDAAGKYVPIERFERHNLTVTSAASFVELVKDECQVQDDDEPKRPGGRVVLDGQGARYFPLVNDPRFVHSYRRTISPDFDALDKLLRAGLLDMVPFVRALQSLRHRIASADTTIRAFRKVTASEHLEVGAAPFLEEGKAGYEYRVSINVRGGKADTAIPANVVFNNVPWTSGTGSPVLNLSTEVDVALVDAGDRKVLKFGLTCPEWRWNEELLRKDEATFIRKQLAEVLPDLLVLEAW